MSQSVYDVAKSNPNEWIKHENCATDDQKWDLAETGGMVKWCTCCEAFTSPNRPCFCGCMVLKRKSDDLFWGGDNGWVDDWKFHAEHFFALSSAEDVAYVLKADVGTIGIYIVHDGWQKEEPKESV